MCNMKTNKNQKQTLDYICIGRIADWNTSYDSKNIHGCHLCYMLTYTGTVPLYHVRVISSSKNILAYSKLFRCHSRTKCNMKKKDRVLGRSIYNMTLMCSVSVFSGESYKWSGKLDVKVHHGCTCLPTLVVSQERFDWLTPASGVPRKCFHCCGIKEEKSWPDYGL